MYSKKEVAAKHQRADGKAPERRRQFLFPLRVASFLINSSIFQVALNTQLFIVSLARSKLSINLINFIRTYVLFSSIGERSNGRSMGYVE